MPVVIDAQLGRRRELPQQWSRPRSSPSQPCPTNCTRRSRPRQRTKKIMPGSAPVRKPWPPATLRLAPASLGLAQKGPRQPRVPRLMKPSKVSTDTSLLVSSESWSLGTCGESTWFRPLLPPLPPPPRPLRTVVRVRPSNEGTSGSLASSVLHLRTAANVSASAGAKALRDRLVGAVGV